MIWRLLNKIFGWDYIAWDNDLSQGIARIHRDKAGRIFYWKYKNINCAEYITSIDKTDVKMWLTCPPEKYLKRQSK